jgi:integrase
MNELITKTKQAISKNYVTVNKDRSLDTVNSYNKKIASIITEIETKSQIDDIESQKNKDVLSACVSYLQTKKQDLSISKFKEVKNLLSIYLQEYRKINKVIVGQLLLSKKELKVKTNPDKVGKARDVLKDNEKVTNYKSIRKPKDTKKDELILKLLYETALRISDIVELKVTSFKLDKETNYYESKIIIKKTSTEHEVFINKDLFAAIVETFKSKVYLLETLQGKKFSRQAINERLKVYGINPHSYRHSRATDLARQNVNAKVIQNLLGHSNVRTTIEYYFNSDKFNPTIHKGKF